MSKLSMLDEKITAKGEDYYVNRCSGANKIRETARGNYGEFSGYYEVEDKIVELQQRVVPEGADDIGYELENVIIYNNPPF